MAADPNAIDIFLTNYLPVVLFTTAIVGYFHMRDRSAATSSAETDQESALFKQKIFTEIEMFKQSRAQHLSICQGNQSRILAIRGAQKDSEKDQVHMTELFRDIKSLQEATNQLLRDNALAQERSSVLHEKMLNRLEIMK